MSGSTKRVIRTLFQVVVAIVTAAPIVLAALPSEVSALPLIVGFGAWVAIVARLINTLEDAGILPSWLKDES